MEIIMDLNNLDNEKYHDFELKIYLKTLDYSEGQNNTMITFSEEDCHPESIIKIPFNSECQTIGECWNILEKKHMELSGQREFFKSWYRNEFAKAITDYRKNKHEI